MTCILGIDPGLSGAIAFYFTDAPSRVAVEDMPVAGKMVSAPILSDLIRRYGPAIAVVESVGSRPGQGVSSTFRFGTAYGIAQGVIGALQIPIEFVAPQRWKKHFRLSGDKDLSRSKAQQLFPACATSFSRVKDHGRAEAALIAKYGAETLFPHSSQAAA